MKGLKDSKGKTLCLRKYDLKQPFWRSFVFKDNSQDVQEIKKNIHTDNPPLIVI